MLFRNRCSVVRLNLEHDLSPERALQNQWIETNDLVEPTENGFHWLGRLDLVVNSGGVKISVEPLEKELSKYFNTSVWVWKVPNEKLGEQLVGFTESQELIDKVNNSYHNKPH